MKNALYWLAGLTLCLLLLAGVWWLAQIAPPVAMIAMLLLLVAAVLALHDACDASESPWL